MSTPEEFLDQINLLRTEESCLCLKETMFAEFVPTSKCCASSMERGFKAVCVSIHMTTEQHKWGKAAFTKDAGILIPTDAGVRLRFNTAELMNCSYGVTSCSR